MLQLAFTSVEFFVFHCNRTRNVFSFLRVMSDSFFFVIMIYLFTFSKTLAVDLLVKSEKKTLTVV